MAKLEPVILLFPLIKTKKSLTMGLCELMW